MRRTLLVLVVPLSLVAVPLSSARAQDPNSTVGQAVGAAADIYSLFHKKKTKQPLSPGKSIPTGPAILGPTGSTGAASFGDAVLQWTVIDDGSSLARTVPANPPAVSNATCGSQIQCVAGVDFRVVSVNAYGAAISEGVPLIVDVVVGNNGRSASATSEGVVCLNDEPASACSSDIASATFTIPPLAPGARAVFRDTLRTHEHHMDGPINVIAVIDPQHESADVNRRNNVALASDKPEAKDIQLEVQSVQLPAQTGFPRNATPVTTVRVHNPTNNLASGMRRMMLKNQAGTSRCSRTYPEFAGTFPSIPPKATVEFKLIMPQLFATCPDGASFSYLTTWDPAIPSVFDPLMKLSLAFGISVSSY